MRNKTIVVRNSVSVKIILLYAVVSLCAFIAGCGSADKKSVVEGWISEDIFRVRVMVPAAESACNTDMCREKTRAQALRSADYAIHKEFISQITGGLKYNIDYESMFISINTEYYEAFHNGRVVFLNFDEQGRCTIIYQVEQKGLLPALRSSVAER